MAVGKPDFDLNSYGIQYKEKKVNYTNKRIGANSQVTTEAEQASEHAKWEKMNKPLGVQSNNSKKRGEPAPKPNAAQAVGSAPRPSPETPKPKSTYTRGYQKPKDETQPATSSPPTEGHEDTSPTVDKIPHAARTRAGGIVDLHGGKGRKQSQGEGLSTLSTQEGGSSHVQMKPSVPKRRGGGGEKDQIADIMQRESRKNPTTPKGYTPPTKKETKDIDSGKDPKGLRGQKGTEYTSQRLASIKSTAEETVFKAISLKLDLMKTTGKNTGDVSAPVTQVTNPETGKVEQKKPFPKKEVFTNDQGNNPNQNPLHVQGKGFKGRQMRRKDPETGEMIKVGKETTTTKIGNVPTKHKKGDIVPHNSPSLQETPENLRRRMDYLMHGEKIGGDLTNTKTQKELDEEHNNKEADAFAQTDAGKRIAAKIAQQNAKKKKLKKSLNDIIIKMNIMKLDIMKETEVERIKKIPANTDEEIQQKRFALSDAMRSDNMAKPDKSLLLD